MIWNKYPFSNLHDLNLDWIISKIKNIETAEANTADYANAAHNSETAAAESAAAAAESAAEAAESAEDASESKTAAAISAEGLENALEEMNITNARIDNLIVDGTPTEGNTELLDIRVGADGVTYETAGTAVRSQIRDLKSAIEVKSELLPTMTTYNNAGSGTLSGDTLTIASGVVATVASRIGRAIMFKDEAFIGKKFILKPHFSVTGDKSIFVKTVSTQTGNDLEFNVVNDDVENLEIILDFTNATLASVSTHYLYVIVNGYNRAPSQTTLLTYTGYDLYEYLGETVADLRKAAAETSLVVERLDGIETAETLPYFISNTPTGVTVNAETMSATATQNVSSRFYIGFRFNSAVFDEGELLLVEYDVATTGNTQWTPYIYPETSDKFTVINASVANGKATFLLRINDSTLNFLLLTAQTIMFYNGDTITVSNVSATDLSVKRYIDSKELSYYSGKELTCFGDSYTMQARWQPTVCSELGMNPFTDSWGQSGGTLTSIYEEIDTINTDADVVTVWIGTNDYSNSRAVGSLNDTVDVQVGGHPTFAGALNYVCDWLAENMAGKTIVFITPTFRHDSADDTFEINNGKNADGYIKNNAGYVLADYADMMVAVANKWSYPCLDLFHNSGINEYTYASYYESDRLHPSDAGAKMLGHKIAMFIIQQ